MPEERWQRHRYIVEKMKKLDVILEVQETQKNDKQRKGMKMLVMEGDDTETFKMIDTQSRETKWL